MKTPSKYIVAKLKQPSIVDHFDTDYHRHPNDSTFLLFDTLQDAISAQKAIRHWFGLNLVDDNTIRVYKLVDSLETTMPWCVRYEGVEA